eukprot:CAMPEP_0197870328 /NCGR_PEP_ID=MMETSP1439-20131203/1079_1 /TAXON_ID=66791 /ORGANISM="Gonyaulax spinifera, Strain CCMP409" /LENGTH=150 /DNA_ID=CAMNT_0043489221 /DNA_START=26 /DNA_END=475 /DNA_ORIENTATION=-
MTRTGWVSSCGRSVQQDAAESAASHATPTIARVHAVSVSTAVNNKIPKKQLPGRRCKPASQALATVGKQRRRTIQRLSANRKASQDWFASLERAGHRKTCAIINGTHRSSTSPRAEENGQTLYTSSDSFFSSSSSSSSSFSSGFFASSSA